MGNFSFGEARRFTKGEAVWVSPSVSSQWLSDDEAVVIEDLGAGYIVLQDSERVPSHGLGHFVCDVELSPLHGPGHVASREMKVRRLREFSELIRGSRERIRCPGRFPQMAAFN